MTTQHAGLPAEVILSINRILEISPTEAEDALDELSDEFNATTTLNTYFPDEASLAQVESIQARLAEQQQRLQDEIHSLRAELKANQDPGRMHLIQEMISDLLGQMSRIREKATESEAVVRNVTKDIQVLDLAKKNLITSMTTLKRLQMLVNALSQLEDLIKERQYGDIAQTLSAVKQISSTFKPFSSIHRIAQILKRIQEVQGELRGMIDADFDTFLHYMMSSYMQDPAKPMKGSVIADACLVVDVLGNDVRYHIIDRYVGLELKEYRRIFRATDEAGQLDNISRRFAWFRRLLQTHEVEQGRVFPAEWKVGWHLLAKFSEVTRDDLTSLLSKAHSSLTVTSLLEYLQTTTEFEATMAKKWGAPFKEILDIASGSRTPQLISTAFDSHMSIFVDAQDRAISDMLAPHRNSKNRKAQPRPSLEAEEPEEPTSTVLPSSTDLFYFYRQSLEQCAKLSTGQPLFDLCTVLKKWLKIYAEDVLTAPKRLAVQTRRSMDSRVGADELKQACLLINTADYCHGTASELEDTIRQKINEEFKEKISLQAEMDIFLGVVSAAIVVQLKELEAVCDSSFGALVRTSWPSMNQVSGTSAYVGELINSVEQCLAIIKPRIEQKKYLRNLFDKTSSLILAKFTNALVKSRPLGEIGAEQMDQLLIDLQIIKASLLKLPGDDLITSSYTKALNKNTTQLEALLKVIVTPADPPEGFILNYTLLIGDASFSNFQKASTPKAEQNDLLDSFVTVTSTKELESTSFLSSLDMEPSSSNQGQLMHDPTSPGLGGRVSFPQVVGAAMSAANIGSDSLLAGLVSPPMSGPPTGEGREQKREVFSGFGRFVSFGRRNSQAPP
ncbi:hypothetical protein PLEOSDRAFT_1104224 [Pleurotus ostreatus PC15]|uniref:Uncharacterized protein n=1 Tax=Pleurotus ostreatus (strain PC15) TaxID=1137138 RepID=A0A067NKI0_PLEO1|nr:hypothetical protein PLEOSDRAFT_1104224 [Pleurotus ostreatus PC15]